jgi:hypothetical protein
MQRYNCIIFTSADNKLVAEDSREVISNSMNICKVFTNNRQSISISSLMSEILQLGEVDPNLFGYDMK